MSESIKTAAAAASPSSLDGRYSLAAMRRDMEREQPNSPLWR